MILLITFLSSLLYFKSTVYNTNNIQLLISKASCQQRAITSQVWGRVTGYK